MYDVHLLWLTLPKIRPSALHHLRLRLGNRVIPISLFNFIRRFSAERRSASCSIFSRFEFAVFSLLLIVSLHFLFHVFINSNFEEVGTQPYSNNIDTFLEILDPIFFSLLTVDSPYSYRYLFSSLSNLFPHFILRIFLSLSGSLSRSILCKKEVFLQRLDIFLKNLKISDVHQLLHEKLPDIRSRPLILLDSQISSECIFCLFNNIQNILKGDTPKSVFFQHKITMIL